MPTLARTRVNLAGNPSFETDVSRWIPVRGTLTRDTTWSDGGAASGLFSVTLTDGTPYAYASNAGGVNNRISPVAQGDYITIRVRVRAVRAGGTRLQVGLYQDSVGIGTAYGSGTVQMTAGEVRDFTTLNSVADAPGTNALLPLLYAFGTDGGQAPLGDHLQIDNLLVIVSKEPLDAVPEFFDGNTKPRFEGGLLAQHSWNGVANNSTSTQSAYSEPGRVRGIINQYPTPGFVGAGEVRGYGTSAISFPGGGIARATRPTPNSSTLIAMIYPVPWGPNEPVSARFKIRRNPLATSGAVQYIGGGIQCYDGGSGVGGATGGTAQVPAGPLTSEWQEATYTGWTTQANAKVTSVGLQIVGTDVLNWGPNDGIEIKDVLFVKSHTLPRHFDGYSPSSVESGTNLSLRHLWEGAVGMSRSYQEAYEQTLPVIIGEPVPGGGWRYFATRFNGDGTETPLDWNVPLNDPEIDEVLSGVNGLSGQISPEVERLVDAYGRPLFEEWSTGLYAEKDGEIIGGGILTNSSFNGKAWDLECGGLIGYWKDMPYTGNGAHYVKTDTLDIVRAIMTHVQNQPGGNIGLIPDADKSGVLVGSELASEEYDPEGGPGGLTLQTQAYKLAWYQDHDLLSNIDGLAEDTPFDYRETHHWSGENIVHRLRFGYPTLGQRRDTLRFVIGENIFVMPSVERAGEDYANEVYALGAGEGAKMIRGYATMPRTRLRRVAVISDSSMRKVNRANSLAETEIRWRQQLEDFTNVIVRDHPHAHLGSYNVGDEVFVEGRTGWMEIGAWCRILSRTIRPQQPGVAELTLVRSDRLSA